MGDATTRIGPAASEVAFKAEGLYTHEELAAELVRSASFRGWPTVVSTLGVAVYISALVPSLQSGKLVVPMIGLGFAGLWASRGLAKSLKRDARRRVQASDEREALTSIWFTGMGVRVEKLLPTGELRESSLEWAQVKRVEITKDGLVLVMTKRRRLPVPKRFLAADAFEPLVTFIWHCRRRVRAERRSAA